jgi:two-component system, NarL family, sensor kinase
MKYLVLFCLLMSLKIEVIAQANLDSLRKAFSKLPNDTASVNTIIKSGKTLLGTDLVAASEVLKLAEVKAISNKDQRQLAKIYMLLGQSYLRKSEAKTASAYYIKCKTIAEKLEDKALLGGIYNDLGAMYLQSRESKSALASYTKALEYCEKDDLDQKGSILGNMGMIYYYLSKEKANQNKDVEIKVDRELLLKAIAYSRQAFELAKTIKIGRKIVNQGSLLSQEYMDLNKADSAVYFMNESEKALMATPNPLLSSSFYFGKGQFYRKQKKYDDAIAAFKESIIHAKKVGMANMEYESYLAIAYAATDKKDFKMAAEYYDKHVTLKDSITNQENFAAAADLQNKYESQKKENEILKLNAENTQKAILNKILIGSVLALLALATLAYFNFKNRQRLQQQKIIELEKDKQLMAASGMIKGQETERNRIAKDLHDGLGGMLSGVKMSFSNLKENLIMSAENVGIFEKTLSQLDSSIKELRKIAHNLVPEALVRFGLKEAVKDFCSTQMLASHIDIVFESLGETRELDNAADTNIYRIIQELVNNAIKHAQCTQILVQLTKTKNKVLLTVEDNGLGIDKAKVALSDGIGFINIKQRVNYFKGQIEFENKLPQGTSINIELNV